VRAQQVQRPQQRKSGRVGEFWGHVAPIVPDPA
jgi:hypothetical protein